MLIAALANYQSLSDDALYDAALRAQQAMVKWQRWYLAIQAEIDFMEESRRKQKAKRKTNPYKLEDPEEYDRKHHESIQTALRNTSHSSGNNAPNTAKPRSAKPVKAPISEGCRPRNDELHIDMNASMQPAEGKRIRKPRVLDIEDTVVSAPKKSLKRTREPEDSDASIPAPDQPAAKKQHTGARSFTPPDWVRNSRAIKLEGEDPVKGVDLAVARKEPEEETKGKDPVRAAAAKLMWAKRRANGTNGRYGGRPADRTVAKAKASGEGTIG